MAKTGQQVGQLQETKAEKVEVAKKADKSEVHSVNSRVDEFNSRIDEIITTPVDGSITQQEIIDARQGETSLGANISKVKNALDFTVTNEIINGDFSKGTTGWYVEPSHFSFQNGAFTITNTGLLNVFLWQMQKEVLKDHIYYFYLDVTNVASDVNFYIRSGNANTFGVRDANNSTKGTGVLKTILKATQNDNGIRIYTLRDNTGVNSNFKVNNFLMVDLTKMFGAGKEPKKEKMDEIVATLGVFYGTRIFSQKEMIKFYSIEDTPSKLNELEQKSLKENIEHELVKSLLKNERLEEEVNFLKTNAMSLMNLKTGKQSTYREIILRSSEKQKLILHLHKRENDGFDTKNDVYLPNAEKYFSDIRITNEDGKVLTYRKTFYTEDFDVIADSRLGLRSNSFIYTDSNNRMINTHQRKISISVDEGKTWEPIPALSALDNAGVTLVSHDDTLFFSMNGVLYRSPTPYTNYTQVLDTRENYTETFILSSNMVQHPDGEMFVGAYQLENVTRIYRSIDNGVTWQQIYNQPDVYQHVHAMYVDVYQNPVAVYAGIDGGGGVLKSIDKGNTWVDLRLQNPSMPQSTDFGVVYADPSGYRLLGGETSIVGGYTLLKTTDDVNFKPVLAAGRGVYNVRKLNGKLYAGSAGTYGFKSASIYMSEDEGETWKAVYNTSPLNDTTGASDGFRYVSVGSYAGASEEQIITSSQSASRSPLRILPNGIYAEIIVEVPEGSEKVIVEDGYAFTNSQPITNDVKESGNLLIDFGLNEGGKVIKENVSGKYFRGNFEWLKSGKQLASFLPPIINPTEKWSILTKSLIGFKVNSFDTSEGLTISFWAKMGYTRRIELIRTNSNDVITIVDGQIRYNNGNAFAYIFPFTLGTMDKIDIVISPNGSIKSYTNGHLRFTGTSQNYSGALTSIQNSSELTLLKTITHSVSDCIQHFTIRKGVISDSQLYQEYNSYITDNMEG